MLPVHQPTVSSMISSCVMRYQAALDGFFATISDWCSSPQKQRMLECTENRLQIALDAVKAQFEIEDLLTVEQLLIH